jgi:peptidoglycan/xylan/chitin deacetylase (PgdA/CDA1 family)
MIKQWIKEAGYGIAASGLFLAPFKRRLQKRVAVVMYHDLADDSQEIEAWTVVRTSDFISQMKFLALNFEVVTLKVAESELERNDSGSLKKPIAVVTFDDGYSSYRRILLPILQSLNIPATIFISTRSVQEQTHNWYDRIILALQGKSPFRMNHIRIGTFEINRSRGADNWREINRLLSMLKRLDPESREAVVLDLLKELSPVSEKAGGGLQAMSIDDLRELSKSPLITIGAHSHCHSILTQLKDEEVRNSVRTSKSLLESWTGRSVTTFAYPNGNFNDRVVRIVKEEGFDFAVTTESRPWKKGESNFTIPRYGIGRYDPIRYFKARVLGGLDLFGGRRRNRLNELSGDCGI